MERIQKWMAEIEASPDKKTVIDIAIIYEEILTSTILTINFGEDLSNTFIEIDMREQTDSGVKLVRKTVPLGVALHEAIGQVTFEASFKHLNPLYQTARKLTGIKDFTQYQTKIVKNCERIRNFIHGYVTKRKNGEIKSQVPDGADLLSLFLKNGDVFLLDETVDELIGFFAEATQTTQFALQTLTSQLANKPEVLQKVRTEFKETVD